ncbi:S41 family peptidase [Gimesia aquarii]|uniref:Putative CtpA-like serine protease n=1 Tax=Gimesia aquarii TaxID=2527964 RepID=A0A517WYV3_9PLAN|nr:S41 family peptidase [Gimesia aquarii]QDU10428.1 putative CtpA-like serine protease [Gimesia aquarii]
MTQKQCCVLILAVGFISNGAFAFTENPENTSRNPKSLEERILTITDVVLQQHIDPPTRQEMILAGVKALYYANNHQVPKGLSQRISNLTTSDQFIVFLKDVSAEFDKEQDLDVILTKGVLSSLPCGAHLIDAKNSKVQEQLAANRYVGVGIAISMNQHEGYPAIPSVIYNGPAWKAGIKPGTLILKVNDKSMKSKALTHVIQHLRGEAGSEVTISIRQPGSQESRTVTMTRGRVFIPTVEGSRKVSEGEWQYTLDAARDIAVFRFSRIGPSTLHELRQIENKLRKEKISGIILDLRSGNGILHDTIMVADSLLDGGVIGHIQSLDSIQKHEARPGALFQNIPLVVLVSKHTSSGHVFLTAALQDNKRAIVIGEPTSGQTYVRSTVSLPNRNDKIVMATALMQRGDGTTLLTHPFRSSPSVSHTFEKTSKLKKKSGFILPDHPLPPSIVNSNIVRRGENSKRLTTLPPLFEKAIEALKNDHIQVPSATTKRRVNKATSGS